MSKSVLAICSLSYFCSNSSFKYALQPFLSFKFGKNISYLTIIIIGLNYILDSLFIAIFLSIFYIDIYFVNVLQFILSFEIHKSIYYLIFIVIGLIIFLINYRNLILKIKSNNWEELN